MRARVQLSLSAVLFVAGVALAGDGVVLEAEGLRVEMVPSPDAIEIYFEGPELASLGNVRLVLRTTAGDDPRQAEPREMRPGRYSFPVDLGGSDAFAGTLLFEHRGESRVLRYPPLSPFPPYLAAEAEHEAVAHGHVTPHDGFVEVFGEHHAELALEADRVRLFWYDVAMNQIPAAGVEAVCFLEPCAGGHATIPLRPRVEGGVPVYLEGGVPAGCTRALRAAFRVEWGGESRTFRHRLPAPLEEWRQAAPVLDETRCDGYLLDLRRTREDALFPLESELELRILEEASLAPLDLRANPSVLFQWGFGGAPLPLPPRRRAAPGRWVVRGWLPPGEASLIGLLFEAGDEAPREVMAWLEVPSSPWLRDAHRGALVCTVAAGLLLLLWSLRGSRGRHDLVLLLGLRPLLASRRWRAFPAWITLALLLSALVSLLAGPADARVNPGAWVVLGLGLPAILMSVLFVGRSWCALCPLPLVTDLASDLWGKGGKPPALSAVARPALVAAQVLAVPAAAASGLLLRSWAVAALLLVPLLVAVGMAVFFGRRSFCATLCPLGGTLEHLEPACPLRLEAGEDRTASCGEGPGRWSVVSAHCTHCGRRAADPAIILEGPFRRERSGLAGSGSLAVALLMAVTLLLLSRHPFWLLLPRHPLAAPVLLYLAGAGLVLLWFLEPGLRRRSAGTAVVLRPLLWASLAAWALPPLGRALAGLPGIATALARAGELALPGAAPLAPDLLLAFQAGLLVTGAALSAVAGWKLSEGRLSGRLLVSIGAGALAGLLLLVLASSFHRTLPL